MNVLWQFCQYLYDSSIGTSIRESTYLFPIIETVHVLAITLLVGTVSLLDLRLLGWAMRAQRVSRLAGQMLPLTWLGFVVMFVSGFLLFWAEAAKSYGNPAFRLKVLLLLLVGLNPLLFHNTVYKTVASWDSDVAPPLPARLAGGASLALWAAIICAGRAIAYFQK